MATTRGGGSGEGGKIAKAWCLVFVSTTKLSRLKLNITKFIKHRFENTFLKRATLQKAAN